MNIYSLYSETASTSTTRTSPNTTIPMPTTSPSIKLKNEIQKVIVRDPFNFKIKCEYEVKAFPLKELTIIYNNTKIPIQFEKCRNYNDSKMDCLQMRKQTINIQNNNFNPQKENNQIDLYFGYHLDKPFFQCNNPNFTNLDNEKYSFEIQCMNFQLVFSI